MKTRKIYYVGRTTHVDDKPVVELIGEGVQPIYFTSLSEANGALTFLKQRSMAFTEFTVISGKIVTP